MASYSFLHLIFLPSLLHLIFCLIVPALQLSVASQRADPLPLQDYCVADLNSDTHLNGFPCKKPSDVTSEDFFYKGFNDEKVFDIYGISATTANVESFPGLNTLGMSMNQFELLKGGLSPPHAHPRATELYLLIKGKVLAGFVTTEHVLFYKVMTPNVLFVVPQGLMHFLLNIGTGRALFYGSFNSQKPGSQFMAHALFNSTPSILDEVLMKSFRINDSTVELIKSKLSVPLVCCHV